MFSRVINLSSVLERKSVFLFGPRQTGKSTWLKNQYPNALYINLLLKKDYDAYVSQQRSLGSDITLFLRQQRSHLIIIDEVQKLPWILDEVHHQIEENKKLRFLLTGSSARKLKRVGINLLGGRASWKSMFPLVYPELKSELMTIEDIERRINRGGLPSVYLSKDYIEDYSDYIQLYLTEEIKAEGNVRNYESFHRFLLTAALMNAKQVNFTQVGSDAQVPPRTIHDYFQVLEDTLIGYMLPAFTDTLSRKAMSSSKFYFFDTGLPIALTERSSLKIGTTEFGDAFEQYIVLEVRAYISYKNKKAKMYYWRSTSKLEVDLIVKDGEKIFALEIKAKSRVYKKDYRGLLAFSDDFPKAKKYVITLDSGNYLDSEDNIEIFGVLEFLKRLWIEDFF